MTMMAFPTGLARKPLRALVFFGITIAVAASSGTSSIACGYHSPQALALGMLNWTFPNALHVRTALWRAERDGILPPSQPQRMPPTLAFRRAALSLRMLADQLSTARAPDAKPMNMSVTLIDSMLWTRFVATSNGYTALVDVGGAHDGDVVVVTASRVIEAMVRGSLDVNVAEEHGLVRLYRQPQAHQALRALFEKATDNEHASRMSGAG
jgi:hypothetical protein